MHFVAPVNDPFARPTLNRALWSVYSFEIYVHIFEGLNFFDGVLCKSSIYKCNEGIDKNIHVTFIKDYVLLEYI